MRVHEKVKEYIEKNCFKQASVAKKAGIRVTTFNAMMNGKKIMYADDLEAICYALNVSSAIFIEPSFA